MRLSIHGLYLPINEASLRRSHLSAWRRHCGNAAFARRHRQLCTVKPTRTIHPFLPSVCSASLVCHSCFEAGRGAVLPYRRSNKKQLYLFMFHHSGLSARFTSGIDPLPTCARRNVSVCRHPSFPGGVHDLLDGGTASHGAGAVSCPVHQFRKRSCSGCWQVLAVCSAFSAHVQQSPELESARLYRCGNGTLFDSSW